MCNPMEAQGKLSKSNELMDLPEALITRILCHVAPKDISSAIRTCWYLNRLIKSPEFLKAYRLSRHESGCIITDNFGSECPEPLLYIYDIISHQWNTIAVAKICPPMLNPRMVSASGGLLLFSANKSTNSEDGRGLLQQSKELVVVQLFSRQAIKLPDTPFVLSSEIFNTCSIEIVVDDMGSSYKVILFVPTLKKDVFWVYNSCMPTWKPVIIPDTGIPHGSLNQIVSRRSVMYRGVLYWLIVGHRDASYLLFYDTQCDALRRPTLCFSKGVTAGLCGIAVCGGKVIRVSKDSRGESELCISQLNEENNDDWEPLFESSVPNMGWDVFCKTGRENDDTKAFKKAWKEACSSAHTVFLVPHGKKYLVKPVRFSGPCKSALTLEVSGTIVAPGDPKVWEGLNRRQWLRFVGINDLTVMGGGTFYGSGDQWWAQSCKINKTNPCQSAPTAVIFESSNNLRVKNIIVENSQQMHIKFRKCVGVHADHLKVLAPGHSPNTDGLHVSASKHVVIKNSIIGTGDDCISIVGDSFNIQIKNISCGPGHGISIGSLGKWNSEARVSRVTVDGASLYDTTNGLRIKTWQGGSGSAKGIKFQNVYMENVKHPIIINQFYCDSMKPCPTKASGVKLSDITYKNIKGTSATKEVMRFACSDMVPCENIVLEDIDLTVSSGCTATTFCENAIGFTIGSVSPQSCLQRCQQCKDEHAITHNFSFLPKDEL